MSPARVEQRARGVYVHWCALNERLVSLLRILLHRMSEEAQTVRAPNVFLIQRFSVCQEGEAAHRYEAGCFHQTLIK
jgi:hypothetical protein